MSFHLYHIRELYSSADGRVQFIEFVGEANGEQFWAGHSLISTNGATTREFVFPSNLPSASTLGRSVLVATQSFAALGLVKPDYVVPDGFLFTAGGSVGVPGMDEVNYGALPGGGTLSVNDNGVVGLASPTNFAGAGATIPGNPILGTAGVDNLVGTGGNDYIVGRSGNDTLNGAAGNDTMLGGAGNDTYIVANAGDRVHETTTPGGTTNAGGTDTVRSSLSYTLGSFVEHLVLTGAGAINGTGNALANSLLGNGAANMLRGGSGNDTLNGAAGNDTMLGGAGNDAYIVANAGDRVIETTTLASRLDAGGTDTVRSSITHTLGSFVEHLVLTGTSAINGTGNALNNSLLGNGAANVLRGGSGNDTLDGAAGNDTMLGGAGNDTYILANVGDRVYETTTVGGTINAGGTDIVRSSLSYTLGSFVEHLVLTGAGAINGSGNTLSNSLTGNGAANVLRGANGNDALAGGAGPDTLHGNAHNDLLRGGAGNDMLFGGTGNDLFRFDTALSSSTVQNVDRIADFDPAADTILLENSIFTRFGTSTTGLIDAAFFRANSTGLAQDSNDYIVYETDTGRLFYDFNGNAAGGSVQFAVLGANLALSSADFVLV